MPDWLSDLPSIAYCQFIIKSDKTSLQLEEVPHVSSCDFVQKRKAVQHLHPCVFNGKAWRETQVAWLVDLWMNGFVVVKEHV